MAKIVKCIFKNMCEDAEKKYLCCYYCDTPRCKYRCKDSVRACTYKEVDKVVDTSKKEVIQTPTQSVESANDSKIAMPIIDKKPIDRQKLAIGSLL